MKQGSKAWWRLERQLQQQKQKCCSIPALKHGKNEWVRTSTEKANLLAKTLSGKYELADRVDNDYSVLTDEPLEWITERAKVLHPAAARDIMRALDESSATGPDAVPTRIIKRCADSLAVPVYLLAMAILSSGRWPDLYTVHWVVCLHKKKTSSTQRTTEGST